MSKLNFVRTAAAALALTMLPAHAVAAAPNALPLASSFVQDDAQGGSADDDGHPFFSSDYLIPSLVVIVLGLVLYLALEDGGDDDGSPAPITP